MTGMKEDIKKIYEAHVAFELQEFQGDALKANIREDVEAAWKWMGKVKLNDIAGPQLAKDFLERNLKDRDLTDHQHDYLVDLGKSVHGLALKSKHTLADFITEKTYFEIANYLIDQKDTRDEIIGKLVKNPFYGEMIADTLYDGLKSFVAQSGPSNETVGGSLFSLGKSLVGAALQGVSENLDRNIKKFIADNLSKTIAQSEKHLKERLSDAKLRMIAKNIWSRAESTKVKTIAEKITTDMIERSIEGGQKVGKDLVAAESVKELAHFVIDHFFEYDGNKTLAGILEDNGITRDIVIAETEIWATPVLEKALKDGFLQARIEARLGKFYETL